MNKPFAVAALLASALLPFSLLAQSPSLAIQVDHPTATVSPTLYGLMTEEINYSYDGGIYGELIRDRTPSQAWDALRLWPMVARGDSLVNVSTDDSGGLSKALARSLRVTVTKASPASPAGVENGGYWGIPVRPHTVYAGSFYAKTDATDIPITVALQTIRPASLPHRPPSPASAASGSASPSPSKPAKWPPPPITISS